MSKTRPAYFESEDILHLALSEEKEAESVELSPNITAELNAAGGLIGVEILNASRNVLIEPDEDGIFVAQVPSLPGCISQGETQQEALDNIGEAIVLYLESLREHGESVPS